MTHLPRVIFDFTCRTDNSSLISKQQATMSGISLLAKNVMRRQDMTTSVRGITYRKFLFGCPLTHLQINIRGFPLMLTATGILLSMLIRMGRL